MSTLYIIGNGFDMLHGLPTSYSDFCVFAERFLSEIEHYYSSNLHAESPWHDFENALGNFDSGSFLDDYNEIDVTADDFRPSFVYGLEDEMTEQADAHVNSIRESFVEWIQQIDVSNTDAKIDFPGNSLFISFNYTSTLQSVYGIDGHRILHIHGNVENNDELIFGHGKHIQHLPDIDDDGESTRDMFSDASGNARYPLHALKKPVEEVLARHSNYFEKLHDIETVVVIGHSLNAIDHPYFKRINAVLPDVIWQVIYYSADESAGFIQSLVACGVNPARISCSGYDYFGFESDLDDEE
jgi:hypothetical protein